MSSDLSTDAALPVYGDEKRFLQVDASGVPLDKQVPVTSVLHLAGATLPTSKIPVQLLDGAGAAIALTFPAFGSMGPYVGQIIHFAGIGTNLAHNINVTTGTTLNGTDAGQILFANTGKAACTVYVRSPTEVVTLNFHQA